MASHRYDQSSHGELRDKLVAVHWKRHHHGWSALRRGLAEDRVCSKGSPYGKGTSMTQDDARAERMIEELEVRFRAAARRWLPPPGSGFTLLATDLVHDAWARELARGLDLGLAREEIERVMYRAMRNALVEYRRRRSAEKRGGGLTRVVLQTEVEGRSYVYDLLELDELLDGLARMGEEFRRVIELRFFAGLSFTEIQVAMGLGEDAVRRRFDRAVSWLRSRLRSEECR